MCCKFFSIAGGIYRLIWMKKKITAARVIQNQLYFENSSVMDGFYLYFDLGNLTITNESFEKLVFPLGIEGDRVHAKPPAVVPCSGPSELFVQTFLQPWKMVSFSKSLKMDCPCYETKIMLKVFQNLWKTERINLSHFAKEQKASRLWIL